MELPQHSYSIVVSGASTPPSPPLAWLTELPLPTSKHLSKGRVKDRLDWDSFPTFLRLRH